MKRQRTTMTREAKEPAVPLPLSVPPELSTEIFQYAPETQVWFLSEEERSAGCTDKPVLHRLRNGEHTYHCPKHPLYVSSVAGLPCCLPETISNADTLWHVWEQLRDDFDYFQFTDQPGVPYASELGLFATADEYLKMREIRGDLPSFEQFNRDLFNSQFLQPWVSGMLQAIQVGHTVIYIRNPQTGALQLSQPADTYNRLQWEIGSFVSDEQLMQSISNAEHNLSVNDIIWLLRRIMSDKYLGEYPNTARYLVYLAAEKQEQDGEAPQPAELQWPVAV